MKTLAAGQLLSSYDLEQNSVNHSFLETKIPEWDESMEGVPRGAITEVFGSPSSGRTSFIHRFLSTSTRQGEYCCLVDSTSSFDLNSASAADVDLGRLLWVRCEHPTDKGRVERAIRASDLVIHSGGWGVVILDLSDI